MRQRYLAMTRWMNTIAVILALVFGLVVYLVSQVRDLSTETTTLAATVLKMQKQNQEIHDLLLETP